MTITSDRPLRVRSESGPAGAGEGLAGGMAGSERRGVRLGEVQLLPSLGHRRANANVDFRTAKERNFAERKATMARKKNRCSRSRSGSCGFCIPPGSANRGGAVRRSAGFILSPKLLGGGRRRSRRGRGGSRSGGGRSGLVATARAGAAAGALAAATATAATILVSATTPAAARVLATAGAMFAAATTASVATVVIATTTAAAARAIATAAAAEGGRGIASTNHGEANDREENRDSKHNNLVHSQILQKDLQVP